MEKTGERKLVWGKQKPLIVQFVVGFKVSLNDLNELFEQVVILHGNEGFHFLAVLFGFHNLHDIQVDGFLFFVLVMIMVTMFASTVAAAIVSIAQYNVFFAVVEEIANHFQQNIVTVFIDTFDEIAGFFFLGGIPYFLF